jgi:predicted nucleotidyltransferase
MISGFGDDSAHYSVIEFVLFVAHDITFVVFGAEKWVRARQRMQNIHHAG